MAVALLTAAAWGQKSITSTSQNRASPPSSLVAEQPSQALPGYRVVAANDLGMHCGDLDHRIVSVLPPFNVLHAQVLARGGVPRILSDRDVEAVYSAASNSQDPALANSPGAVVYKTNFWEMNPRTGRSLAFDAYDPHYPPGILPLFPLLPDRGLPVPDLQRLYLGDRQLSADQQAMPGVGGPYAANTPQRFALFYRGFPFFINFPFGYSLSAINWFSAEGIPITPFDDTGRLNPYPLARVQARAAAGNRLGLAPGTVLASVDTPLPVSGEVDCRNCHSSRSDGGNGSAVDNKGFVVANRTEDPLFGSVPEDISIEYAFDLNIVRLHDRKHGTNLEQSAPVSCQTCHYTPALDLAHLGPKGPGDPVANGRQQTSHASFSRVMHSFHGLLRKTDGTLLFPEMPPPNGRSSSVRDAVLVETCYQCHPGRRTQCFRGAMFSGGLACQDCHGGMTQVGNDFSRNVSAANPGAFILAADYYTNPQTPRVPWANEPGCQSCHTGDAAGNLAGSNGVIPAADGIRLLQAYRTGDSTAKPILASNRRFAENQADGKQVLYRLSRGHGGVFCQGCHGSTHAEWPEGAPNANDNVPAGQLQGFAGPLIECASCHTGSFRIEDFKGNLDANGWMKGPHGMHPVGDAMWVDKHKEVFEDGRTPAGNCQACHGSSLQGSVLARMPVDRVLECKETRRPGCVETSRGKRITLRKGTQVGCGHCHQNPRLGD